MITRQYVGLQMQNDPICVNIANISETYHEYLQTDSDSYKFFNKLGYRAALWKGNRRIAISSLPIPNKNYLRSVLQIAQLTNIYPHHSSYSLCSDILREDNTFNKLISACRESSTVEFIPYGTTKEFLYLADRLTEKLRRYDINVLLPESILDQDLLCKFSFLDTKVGFRDFVSNRKEIISNIHLPDGYVAHNYQEAVDMVRWFRSLRKECVCKSSVGVFGLAAVRFLESDRDLLYEDISMKIKSIISQKAYPVVVEEFIRSDISPSIEAYIPQSKDEQVEITYPCLQNFTQDGLFEGISIGPDILSKYVTSIMSSCAIKIGTYLKSIGYIGFFDLDFVVDAAHQKIYILEINLRRTGGTHVHEIACHLLGINYIKEYYVRSTSNLRFSKPLIWKELLKRIGQYSFPMISGEGVIIARGFQYSLNPELIIIAKNCRRIFQIKEMIEATL